MTDALQFEVKKDKWEQLQNGSYKLTVTMNPTDLTDNNDTLLLDFIKSAPGSRFILAAVRITDNEQPAVQKPKMPFKDLPPSQQAGIRCNDTQFQNWCRDNSPGFFDLAGVTVADFVRHYCGVESRAEINTKNFAAKSWRSLNAQFEADTRLPERR